MSYPRWWRERSPLSYALWPLTWLYRAGFAAHRFWQQRQRTPLPVPVVVVGNLAVGGTGKTPVVQALVMALQRRGRRVGVIARGHGGELARLGGTERVSGSEAARHGDEPTLIAWTTGAPVVVGRDRLAAAKRLLSEVPKTELIVSDDGLQHHRLPRALAISVMDRAALGNGWLLPAGPLREPLSRLDSVDAVLWRDEANPSLIALPSPVRQEVFRVEPVGWLPLRAFAAPAWDRAAFPLLPLSQLSGRHAVAIAGIGQPQRFAATLERLGVRLAETRFFPDHHAYRPEDLPPVRNGEVRVFTPKDAVKCAAWARQDDYVLWVEAQLPPGLVELVDDRIRGSSFVGNPGLSAV